MFRVTIGLKDIGDFADFPAAFREFHGAVLQNKSLQVIETACWIAYRVPGGNEFIMNVYDAGEHALRWGLLTEDGKLVENPNFTARPEEVRNAFIQAHVESAFAHAARL